MDGTGDFCFARPRRLSGEASGPHSTEAGAPGPWSRICWAPEAVPLPRPCPSGSDMGRLTVVLCSHGGAIGAQRGRLAPSLLAGLLGPPPCQPEPTPQLPPLPPQQHLRARSCPCPRSSSTPPCLPARRGRRRAPVPGPSPRSPCRAPGHPCGHRVSTAPSSGRYGTSLAPRAPSLGGFWVGPWSSRFRGWEVSACRAACTGLARPPPGHAEEPADPRAPFCGWQALRAQGQAGAAPASTVQWGQGGARGSFRHLFIRWLATPAACQAVC